MNVAVFNFNVFFEQEVEYKSSVEGVVDIVFGVCKVIFFVVQVNQCNGFVQVKVYIFLWEYKFFYQMMLENFIDQYFDQMNFI